MAIRNDNQESESDNTTLVALNFTKGQIDDICKIIEMYAERRSDLIADKTFDRLETLLRSEFGPDKNAEQFTQLIVNEAGRGSLRILLWACGLAATSAATLLISRFFNKP